MNDISRPEVTSEEDVGTARPILTAPTLPVLVRVAIHQLTGDRISFLPEPLGTVDGVRMICGQTDTTSGLRDVLGNNKHCTGPGTSTRSSRDLFLQLSAGHCSALRDFVRLSIRAQNRQITAGIGTS